MINAMVKSKCRKNESSDREKWNKVFNALVHMLQNQQIQLESLAKERKLLQDRIKLQHERWVSDVNLFQDQISQMKSDFTARELERMVEAAKVDWAIGLKRKEAFVYKHKFENADSELADFRLWFDYLSDKGSGKKDASKSKNSEGKENRCGSLESELRRLKCEYDKLTLDKNTEVSSLLAEKNFAWNQYNNMERDFNEQLRLKCAEVESANNKIQALLAGLEESQASNTVKENKIVTLKDDCAKLKSDLVKKDEEVSRLSKELEALRKSRNDSQTPVLHHCTADSRNSRFKCKNGRMDGRTVTVKKELDSSRGPEKCLQGSRSSKRKAPDTVLNSDTPKLFTSSFRVPKLKNL